MTYISLHYKIITSKYDPPSSTYQCYNFSSMIKNKIDGWVSIYLNNQGYFYKCDLINEISKQACIPYNTIVGIYLYNRTYVDECKNYTNPFNRHGIWRSYNGYNTIYYAYVNLSIDPVFNNHNNTQINEENNKKYLEERVSSLNSTISNLNNQNWRSNNKISDLTSENRKLRENQEKIKRELTEKNDKLQRNLNDLEGKYNNLEYNHQTKINNLNNENRNLRIKIEKKKIRWIKKITNLKKIFNL